MEFLHFLAQYRTSFGDAFFQGVTYLAQETLVVAIMCWLLWCSDKKLAYTLGFSYFSSGLLVQGLKITFRVPRPWVLDPDFQPVASAVPDATGYSFPSGHTQSITSLMGTLACHFRKACVRILCFLMILAVMFSRLYLGCHTPQDVGVSFIITVFCAVLCYHFFYRKNVSDGHEAVISIIMVVICVLLTVYAVILNKNGTVDVAYALDCVKASGAGIAFAIGMYMEIRWIRFEFPHTTGQKIIRFLVGILITLGLQVGLKPILGSSMAASFLRYFLTVAWITFLYPFLFSRKRIPL